MRKSTGMALKERLVLHLMDRLRYYLIVMALSFIASCRQNSSTGEPNTMNPNELAGLEPFFRAVQENPDSVVLYQVLVDTLANRGLFTEAAAWCDSAIKHETIFPAGWLLAKGDLHRKAAKYDSAIAAYKQYLYIFPDDEQILLNLANAYAEKGDSATLVLTGHINSLFSSTETRSGTAFINGIYFSTIKNFAEARKRYDSAIALRYNFLEAWMERGYAFYDEGKYKEAAQNFFQLTNLNKANADAWYWMAKSEEAMGENEKAKEHYARAFSLDRNLTAAKLALERLRK